MSSPTTAKRAIAAIFVLACPLIAVFFVLKPKVAPREPRPAHLTPATQVANAPQWSETPLSGNVPYQWYSQNAFLYRRSDHSLASASIAPGEHDVIGDVMHSYLSVGGALEDTGPTGPSDWMLSPDRRWLLTYLGVPGRRRWAAIKLDGTRHVTCPARFNFQPLVCWKADSSGWIEIFRGEQGPNVASYRLSSKTISGPVTPLVSRQEGYYGRPEVLGGVGDGIAVATWVEDDRHRMPIRLFHFQKPGIEPTHLHITLPRQATLMETELSPNGRRLAWVFVVPDRGKHGLQLPFFKSRVPEVAQQLWLSDLDGARMHRIAASSQRGEELKEIHFLRWLPDGKKLSFVNRDAIYTIPAM